MNTEKPLNRFYNTDPVGFSHRGFIEKPENRKWVNINRFSIKIK